MREIKADLDSGDSSDSATAPQGREIVVPLLERCLIWADIVLEKCVAGAPDSACFVRLIDFSFFRKGRIDPRFKATYDNLSEIRNQLERLSITQAWSLRETDLYNFQRQLDRVDESRVNGNFEDSEGHAADLHAQRVSVARLAIAVRYLLTQSPDPSISFKAKLRLHLYAHDRI